MFMIWEQSIFGANCLQYYFSTGIALSSTLFNCQKMSKQKFILIFTINIKVILKLIKIISSMLIFRGTFQNWAKLPYDNGKGSTVTQ